MHKHSEPDNEELKSKQIPTDLFEQKNSEAVFFASDYFNIPYQVCLTAGNRGWKISPVLIGEIFPRIGEILPHE